MQPHFARIESPFGQMAVQILSDLHLEAPKAYDIFDIAPKAPDLTLLGDTGTINHNDDYLSFLIR